MQTSVRCLDQTFVRMDSVQISFRPIPATVALASTMTTSGLSVWVRNEKSLFSVSFPFDNIHITIPDKLGCHRIGISSNEAVFNMIGRLYLMPLFWLMIKKLRVASK